MNDGIIAGADIGGSHITVALIDTHTWNIIDGTCRRNEIDTAENAEEIFDAWSLLIRESFYAINTRPSKIGIAMPGPFDYVNGVCYIKGQNKYDALYGVNVKEKLAGKLETSEENITILNDAECFLQGEMSAGAGKGFNRVIGLTLGTGLGSARFGGEETKDANLWCSKYKDGIAEDYLSTRWFLKRYNEISGKNVKNVKMLASQINKNGLVQSIFNEFGINLANFLTPLIQNEKVQLVILGGNISRSFRYFSSSLIKTLDESKATTEIRTTLLGENAALIGAANGHYQFSTFSKYK